MVGYVVHSMMNSVLLSSSESCHESFVNLTNLVLEQESLHFLLLEVCVLSYHIGLIIIKL